MVAALTLLFLLAVLALLVGLVKPSLVVRWNDSPTRGSVLVTYGGLSLFVVILVGILAEPETGARTEPPEAEPPSPREVALEAVREVLGRSNRDVQRLSQFAWDTTVVQLTWAINDNLTPGLLKGGARNDVAKILEALDSSYLPFETAQLRGTFALMDQFGNSEEEIVVEVQYNRSTINRINWEGFLTENVYDIADEARIHPELR